MTEFLDGVSPGNAEPTSVESAPDRRFDFVAEPDGASGGQVATDNEADMGGHTLLSRSPVLQGRRSLFRR